MRSGYWCLALCAVATSTSLVAKGPLNMWYFGTRSEASEKLALLCADLNAAIVEQEDSRVVCQRESGGIAARLLFSGRGGTTPMLNVRFTLLKDGPDTRIQASQWIEVESALGQNRRTELDDQKADRSLREKLYTMGAHDFPSSAAETPQP